jgi:PPOX class probable F420-dependent enzyme
MMTAISPIAPALRPRIARARVARFATSNGARLGLVPVCFALIDDTLYQAIDAKPKRQPALGLARIMNIQSNANAVMLIDHYDEDWRKLWYVLVRGQARVIDAPDGEQHRAVAALRRKYIQYRTTLPLSQDAVVIALDAERLTHWEASSTDRSRRNRPQRRA